MTIKALRSVALSSFTAFLAEETDNILNGTSERNLCGRLAPLLERGAAEAGFTGYKADVEYNRNQGGKIKTIVDDHLHIIPITCDLILHSRGTNTQKDNLIAIEMKRSTHPEAEKQKDRVRLRALTKLSFDGLWSVDGVTLPEHVCGYELGYFAEINIKTRTLHIEEYIGGEQHGRHELIF